MFFSVAPAWNGSISCAFGDNDAPSLCDWQNFQPIAGGPNWNAVFSMGPDGDNLTEGSGGFAAASFPPGSAGLDGNVARLLSANISEASTAVSLTLQVNAVRQEIFPTKKLRKARPVKR